MARVIDIRAIHETVASYPAEAPCMIHSLTVYSHWSYFVPNSVWKYEWAETINAFQNVYLSTDFSIKVLNSIFLCMFTDYLQDVWTDLEYTFFCFKKYIYHMKPNILYIWYCKSVLWRSHVNFAKIWYKIQRLVTGRWVSVFAVLLRLY